MQDGFDLYLHGFIVTDDGNWTVVQQGMNGARKQARRYHWLSEGLKSFVDDPHAAIDGKGQGEIVNLADRRAEASRRTQLDLLSSLGPDKIAREYSALETRREQQAKPSTDQPLLPHLIMPAHHDVRSSDVIARRLHGNLAAAADRGPKDFPDLLLTPGVGARTVRALAMVAEVMHGAPCRFTDPARFSVAHGGKDRHPFPVPLKVYDETIKVLKSAVQKAKLGRDEELGALRRLDEQSRKLERHANGPTVANLIAEELDRSHSYGGRSVFGWEPPPADSSDRVRRHTEIAEQIVRTAHEDVQSLFTHKRPSSDHCARSRDAGPHRQPSADAGDFSALSCADSARRVRRRARACDGALGHAGPAAIRRCAIANIRNVKSPHWRPWLKPESCCVVPFTSSCEYADTSGRRCRHGLLSK